MVLPVRTVSGLRCRSAWFMDTWHDRPKLFRGGGADSDRYSGTNSDLNCDSDGDCGCDQDRDGDSDRYSDPNGDGDRNRWDANGDGQRNGAGKFDAGGKRSLSDGSEPERE